MAIRLTTVLPVISEMLMYGVRVPDATKGPGSRTHASGPRRVLEVKVNRADYNKIFCQP